MVKWAVHNPNKNLWSDLPSGVSRSYEDAYLKGEPIHKLENPYGGCTLNFSKMFRFSPDGYGCMISREFADDGIRSSKWLFVNDRDNIERMDHIVSYALGHARKNGFISVSIHRTAFQKPCTYVYDLINYVQTNQSTGKERSIYGPGVDLPQNLKPYPDIDEDYLCPISYLPMLNPVMVSDGTTYDRSSIEKWFSRSKKLTSPKTNLPLRYPQLYPAILLKNKIQSYIEEEDKKSLLKISATVKRRKF